MFRAWRAELEPLRRPGGAHGHIRGWSSKLDGATARLAGLFHLAETAGHSPRDPISGATLQAAIEIRRFFAAHALATFGDMGADPVADDAQRVFDWLRERGKDTFTKRECHRALEGHFHTAATLAPALDRLLGWLRLVPAGHGSVGRPSKRYAVHPTLMAKTSTEPTEPTHALGSVDSVDVLAQIEQVAADAWRIFGDFGASADVSDTWAAL